MTTDAKTIHITTSCRDCCFAKFDDAVENQIACEANRLVQFGILEKTKIKVDKETDLKYYEIQGVCNMCRPTEWAKNYENPLDRAIKEVKTSISFVVLAKDNDDALIETLSSAYSQAHAPQKIVVMNYRRAGLPTRILDWFKGCSNLQYEVVNILDTDDIGVLIDRAARKLKSHYYTILEEGKTIPSNFTSRLNKAINQDLCQISMIRPKDGLNGLTVHLRSHNTLGGNNNLRIWEKIDELAKNQGLTHMIYSYSTLFEKT
jgi:hypothetical protein